MTVSERVIFVVAQPPAPRLPEPTVTALTSPSSDKKPDIPWIPIAFLIGFVASMFLWAACEESRLNPPSTIPPLAPSPANPPPNPPGKTTNLTHSTLN